MAKITLDIRVEPAQWEGVFDRIEVWRSTVDEGGPFEELTATSYLPARLPAGSPDPPTVAQVGHWVNVVDLDLHLFVMGERRVRIVFEGVDPLTYGAAATQIQNADPGLLRSYVVEGQLVIETTRAGRAAALEVLGGDAAPALRLPTQLPAALVYGRDARLALLPGVTSYSFVDPYGDKKFIYKTRFRNEQTGAVSEFSAPPSLTTGLASTNLARGFVRLVDMSGKPLVSYNVLVQNSFRGVAAAGAIVAAGSQEKLTNNDGYAEFTLVRGLIVTVAVAGTNLVREVVVPVDPAVDLFDLFDPAAGEDDLFKVRVPNIDFAERRSL